MTKESLPNLKDKAVPTVAPDQAGEGQMRVDPLTETVQVEVVWAVWAARAVVLVVAAQVAAMVVAEDRKQTPIIGY